MAVMFYEALAFNQPIGAWNTGAVRDMSFMFYGASMFNQNIRGWNVAAVIIKPPTEFKGNFAPLTEQNSPVWF
jgi:hypothetical protein